MNYRVIWTSGAVDDLRGLAPASSERIVSKVETYLVQDPTRLGKPLRSDKKGFFSYRFGDYRVVYTVDKDRIVIIVARVGHRKDVYR